MDHEAEQMIDMRWIKEGLPSGSPFFGRVITPLPDRDRCSRLAVEPLSCSVRHLL